MSHAGAPSDGVATARTVEEGLSALLFWACIAGCGAWWPKAAHAQAAAANFVSAEPAERLQLEVSVNGLPKGLVIGLLVENGRFLVTPADLRDIGVEAGKLPLDARGTLALDDIPGLRYVYRRETQQLELQVDAARLIAEQLGNKPPPTPPPQAGYGLVVNYSAHLQAQSTSLPSRVQSSTPASVYGQRSVFAPPTTLTDVVVQPFDLGQSAGDTFTRALGLYTDSRFFTPFGTLYNGGFFSLTDAVSGPDRKWTRMDTQWVYSDPQALRTFVAGDFISTALTGVRAVRLGGLQLHSNFALRPDLVTFPVPVLGGSAVVPSAVDLYVNNIRQFSGGASGGPFVIDTPPALTGAGKATIVVEDPLGRRTTTTLPIYVDAQMLQRGLSDYAIEAGHFRNNYGLDSFDYSSNLAANGAFRYGVNDALTVEVRSEATDGLVNVGAGALARLGQYGVVGAWLDGSGGDSRGEQAALMYRYVSSAWSLAMFAAGTRDQYRDLGSTKGVPVPLRQQRFLFGLPFAGNQNLSFSYVRIDTRLAGNSRIAALGYTASLGSRFSVFGQAFRDLEHPGAHGFYLGLSMNLDGQVTAYSNVARVSDQTIVSAGANKPVDYDAGGFGWAVEGDGASAGDYRHALVRGGYLGAYGEAAATAEKFSHATMGSLDVRGSLVVMDGTLLASRAVDDAFAMVSTDGVAGIPVLRENRLVGTTNDTGHFVIPDLHSFQSNRLAIDTQGLPADARITVDNLVAVPRDGAGVLAHFPVARYHGASLILVDAQGKVLPVGTRVTLQESGVSGLVGYDGLVFFEALAPLNHLVAELDEKTCVAEATFDAGASMTTLGPFTCIVKETSP